MGTQNVPLNKRNTGVRPPGQTPLSRTSPTGKPSQTRSAAEEYISDEELIELLDKVAEERGVIVDFERLGLEKAP